MPFTTVTATIPADDTKSNAIDTSAGELHRLAMPAEWTAARLTFEMSVDGITFNSVYDPLGKEVSINVHAGTTVFVPQEWRAVSFIRLRSGTRDRPVVQSAARAFLAVIKTGGGP